MVLKGLKEKPIYYIIIIMVLKTTKLADTHPEVVDAKVYHGIGKTPYGHRRACMRETKNGFVGRFGVKKMDPITLSLIKHGGAGHDIALEGMMMEFQTLNGLIVRAERELRENPDDAEYKTRVEKLTADKKKLIKEINEHKEKTKNVNFDLNRTEFVVKVMKSIRRMNDNYNNTKLYYGADPTVKGMRPSMIEAVAADKVTPFGLMKVDRITLSIIPKMDVLKPKPDSKLKDLYNEFCYLKGKIQNLENEIV